MNESNTLQSRDDGQQRGIVRQGMHAVSFSGPLPHPAILKQYNNVVPGAADRIIAMAENQSRHRQDLERRVITTGNTKSILGMIFGFVIALVGFGGGIYAAFNGKPFFGSAVSIGTLAAVVVAFVVGADRHRKALQRKPEVM